MHDEPNAIDLLKAQAEELERRQQRMKDANAYYRKHGSMAGYEGLTSAAAEVIDQKIKGSHSWKQQPYPAYLLTSNLANLKRIRGRIAELERKAEKWQRQLTDNAIRAAQKLAPQKGETNDR